MSTASRVGIRWGRTVERDGVMELPTKPCAVCGRSITWRKKWARDWEGVRYCSDACRRGGMDCKDVALERAIIGLLHRRARGASICPSEAAKVVDPEGWMTLMERARRAARRLEARGEVVITQRGAEVDGSRAKGPIRVRLR
ncbi:DUF2256 and DUF3253 domain-containing protein [Leptolyngbya sp. 15MV]|nr:DUF2256 and DUF3253 domain-containing protein [Leptolyngbya sp. 15MV]